MSATRQTLRRNPDEPLVACAETRALVAEIGRLVRRGQLDQAADLLEAELDATYTAGHIDGYGEGADAA
jgi:hypothetical protein